MRANIGFILIGLGLIGAYIALGGKFGKSSSAGSDEYGGSAVGDYGLAPKPPFANNPTPVTGGASQPANVPYIPPPIVGPGETPKDPTTGSPVGSGGQSWQSRWTQFGHIIAISPLDRRASGGGYR